MLQSVAECCRVLQSVTECFRVFLAHLLGPIFGLVFALTSNMLCAIRWLTSARLIGSDSGLTSGPTSPNSLTSGISSGNEKVRLPHLDRSSCLELTISSFDIAYIVIFLMALHRRPEFNADLASGSADDHIALSIVHLLSRKLRLMLIVVLQPINYCMAFIFPFPKIAMRHNRCS